MCIYWQEVTSHIALKGVWATQGVDGWDVDLPTYLEANWITGFVAKAAWVLVYIIVYGLRPVLIRPKPIGESSPTWGQAQNFHLMTAPAIYTPVHLVTACLQGFRHQAALPPHKSCALIQQHK